MSSIFQIAEDLIIQKNGVDIIESPEAINVVTAETFNVEQTQDSDATLSINCPKNILVHLGYSNFTQNNISYTTFFNGSIYVASDTERLPMLNTRGKLNKLFLRCNANTFTGTFTVTILLNGLATALICVLSSGQTSVTNTINEIEYVYGQEISMKFQTSAGSGSVQLPTITLRNTVVEV